MRKLSIRSRGSGTYQVGPVGHRGPTVVVRALTKPGALVKAKDKLRSRGQLAAAVEATFRDNPRIKTRLVKEEV